MLKLSYDSLLKRTVCILRPVPAFGEGWAAVKRIITALNENIEQKKQVGNVYVFVSNIPSSGSKKGKAKTLQFEIKDSVQFA